VQCSTYTCSTCNTGGAWCRALVLSTRAESPSGKRKQRRRRGVEGGGMRFRLCANPTTPKSAPPPDHGDRTCDDLTTTQLTGGFFLFLPSPQPRDVSGMHIQRVLDAPAVAHLPRYQSLAGAVLSGITGPCLAGLLVAGSEITAGLVSRSSCSPTLSLCVAFPVLFQPSLAPILE
jgi:hypothetical protein